MTQPDKSFAATVRDYQAFATGRGMEVSITRAEVHVESMRDWSQVGTIEEAKAWFVEQRESCPMVVVDIALNEVGGWSIDQETGNVSRDAGGFFTVHGVRVTQSAGREVGQGWDQPILTQVGYDGGLLGILRKRISGVPHYLIEAKAEPGNYEKVQLSPTLQATFSNLARAHAGRKPRFAEYFEDPESHGGRVLYSRWLSEDGGRLHLKRNRGMLVEVAEQTAIGSPDSFRWMSMWQIKDCLMEDAWVNPHIRGIIAHL